jgi:soluble lytic murein transglycosylase-like protein
MVSRVDGAEQNLGTQPTQATNEQPASNATFDSQPVKNVFEMDDNFESPVVRVDDNKGRAERMDDKANLLKGQLQRLASDKLTVNQSDVKTTARQQGESSPARSADLNINADNQAAQSAARGGLPPGLEKKAEQNFTANAGNAPSFVNSANETAQVTRAQSSQDSQGEGQGLGKGLEKGAEQGLEKGGGPGISQSFQPPSSSQSDPTLKSPPGKSQLGSGENQNNPQAPEQGHGKRDGGGIVLPGLPVVDQNGDFDSGIGLSFQNLQELNETGAQDSGNGLEADFGREEQAINDRGQFNLASPPTASGDGAKILAIAINDQVASINSANPALSLNVEVGSEQTIQSGEADSGGKAALSGLAQSDLNRTANNVGLASNFEVSSAFLNGLEDQLANQQIQAQQDKAAVGDQINQREKVDGAIKESIDKAALLSADNVRKEGALSLDQLAEQVASLFEMPKYLPGAAPKNLDQLGQQLLDDAKIGAFKGGLGALPTPDAINRPLSRSQNQTDQTTSSRAGSNEDRQPGAPRRGGPMGINPQNFNRAPLEGSDDLRKAIDEEKEKQLPEPYIFWIDIIQEAAEKYSLEPAIIVAIIDRESGGENRIHANGFKHGLMGIDIREHRGWLEANQMGLEPTSNIDFGVACLRERLNLLGGNLPAGIAAYDASVSAVDWALKSNLPVDVVTTDKNYSADVLARADFFRNYFS